MTGLLSESYYFTITHTLLDQIGGFVQVSRIIGRTAKTTRLLTIGAASIGLMLALHSRVSAQSSIPAAPAPEVSAQSNYMPTLQGPAMPPSTQPSQQINLSQAIALALQTNPAARAAGQQLAQAQAALALAEAQRRLQVTFDSTVSGSNADVPQPPPSHETFGTLQNTLSVPLPIGRKPSLAVAQAQAQLSAAQAQYRSARLALAGQVATAYFDLLRKQALLAAAQQSLNLAQQQYANAQKRFQAGDVPQLDVLQAQVPAANAAAALTQAQTTVAISQETINDLLGRPLDQPITLADVTGMPLAPAFSLPQARTLALRSSQDVAAADATVRADRAALQSARLWREPTVSLQAIDIRSGDVTSFSREDTLQAQVSIPLVDGGVGRAQAQAAQAALSQAQAQAQSARKTALVNVSSAYLTAQSSGAQVAATRAALDIAQITYDKTVLGYQNGLNPLVDVLTAQNALAQARIVYIQSLYDAASAQNALSAAVQGAASTGQNTGTGSAALQPAPMPPAPQASQPTGSTQPPSSNASGTSPAGANQAGTSTPSGTSTTGPNTTGKGSP